MKQLATGLLAIAMGLGLAACDNSEEPVTEAPTVIEAPEPGDPGAIRPDSNPPSEVPEEPIDPTGITPSEPPDAGTHGIEGGVIVPEGNEASPGNLEDEEVSAEQPLEQ